MGSRVKPAATMLEMKDIADNPGNSAPTYCGSGTMTESLSLHTTYPGQTMSTPLCRDHQTIFDTAVAQGFTWRYYAAWGKKHKNLWAPTQAIQHLYNSPYFVPNPSAILTDISNGTLANIAFVTPISSNSDHPKDMTSNTASQQWVASIVNAIGESPYWNNTVIIIYWDDFGGWFDHVPPVFATDPFLPSGQNPNEYGFRLPYGVVSAYANAGTVSHAGPCSASDSLNFIEGNTWPRAAWNRGHRQHRMHGEHVKPDFRSSPVRSNHRERKRSAAARDNAHP